MPDIFTLRPIGTIRSSHVSRVGVPIQTAAAPAERAMLVVDPEFRPGLADVEGFEYLFLITLLHLVTKEPLTVVPFLDTVARGVFATRAPTRPNRIGLSIVRVVVVRDSFVEFEGNDMVDGTPVLDIKPYVPAFDVRTTSRVGWFAGRLDELPGKRADERMGAERSRQRRTMRNLLEPAVRHPAKCGIRSVFPGILLSLVRA